MGPAVVRFQGEGVMNGYECRFEFTDGLQRAGQVDMEVVPRRIQFDSRIELLDRFLILLFRMMNKT